MTGLIRAELFKQRTTRTSLTLLVSMLGLIMLVVCLHVFTLNATALSQAANQPKVFGWGTTIGALFAALLGAIGITGEFRHGTIRPTLLINPDRRRIVVAKAVTTATSGLLVGLIAEALVIAIASAGLAIRGIPNTLTGDDFAQMLLGGAAAAALWAVIGTGLGTVVRNQIAAVAGLSVWLLLLENILLGNVPSIAKFTPGSAAGAISGMIPDAGSVTLLAPLLGVLMLLGYAALATAGGLVAIDARDID
jgi:ABC-type transport system involved in multi-copper enzyme maturation permease subunit